MKKLIVLILFTVVTMAFVGCGNGDNDTGAEVGANVFSAEEQFCVRAILTLRNQLLNPDSLDVHNFFYADLGQGMEMVVFDFSAQVRAGGATREWALVTNSEDVIESFRGVTAHRGTYARTNMRVILFEERGRGVLELARLLLDNNAYTHLVEGYKEFGHLLDYDPADIEDRADLRGVSQLGLDLLAIRVDLLGPLNANINDIIVTFDDHDGINNRRVFELLEMFDETGDGSLIGLR